MSELDWPIFAVDPGTIQSAFVIYDPANKSLLDFGILDNPELIRRLQQEKAQHQPLAIEMMASMGMAVGQSVLETATWIGRFIEAWLRYPGHTYELVYRMDEKLLLCGSTKAKDSNIRQAIMDRYGSTRAAAIGTKNKPGPLYGVSKDVWAAIAVALVAVELPHDQRRAKGGVTL